MMRRRHFPLLLTLAAALALPVPFLVPEALAQNPEPITIGAADIQDRELVLMRETKKQLAETARALARETSADPAAVHTAAYAQAWEQYQEQLNRARKRVWWNKTPDVALAPVTRPSSTAMAARNRELAAIRQQREEAQRQIIRDTAEFHLRAEQLRTQQEIAHHQRLQSAAALEQTALLAEIHDRGVFAPLYPVAVSPVHKPVIVGRPGWISHPGKKGVVINKPRPKHPGPVPGRL